MNGKKFWIPLLLGIGWLVVSTLLLGVLSFFADTEWIRAAGFFLAGVGVAPLGLWLAHRRTASLSSQTENEIARRVTDSFTKAMELLGHAEIAVRQGGIYALGRIAAENREEHPKIMSIIAAYIRHRSRAYVEEEHKKENKSPSWDEFIKNHISQRPSPIDLEAAVAVIRGRNTAFDIPLVEGVPFLDLSGVFLFRINFAGASLEQVDFTGSILRKCIFQNAKLNDAIMHGANFTDSKFYEADMSGIQAEGAIFSLAAMNEAKMCDDAYLTAANFQEASMGGVDFSNAELSGADFQRADLLYVNFSSANLGGGGFAGADVRNAKFDKAGLYGTDLSKAIGLTAEQIENARGNAATKLPKGIKLPDKWKGPRTIEI